MQLIFARMFFPALLLASVVPLAAGQVSVEEAERRLNAKLATRPSTTRPSAEIDRLREENLRLRERASALEQEVITLKDMLARATRSAAGPVTRPTTGTRPDSLEKTVLGHWRGGDVIAGTSYLIQFDSDGVYKQTFITQNVKESGQYRIIDQDTMEMWSDKWPENKRHNQYQITATPLQVTLTPLVVDGFEVKAGRAVILRRAE